MNKNKTIIGIVLSGILAVGAQARQNDVRDNRGRGSVAVSQKQGKVLRVSNNRARVQNVRANNRITKLPRNFKRVAHRGVTYYISNGVCYQPTRGGYISVRRPW